MNTIKVMKGTYTFKGVEHEFEYYTNISLKNKCAFIKNVIAILFDDGVYLPVIRNFAFNRQVIERFTGLNLDIILSDAFGEDYADTNGIIDSMNEFFEETKIVDIITANATEGVIDELNRAIDDNIESVTGIHHSETDKSVHSLLKAIEDNINGVDSVSWGEIIQKILNMGEITPDSIVGAYKVSMEHDKLNNELLDAKNEEIRQLKAKNNELTAHNVLADKDDDK